MNLDQLQKIAEAAQAWSETIGETAWYSPAELVTIGTLDMGKYKDVETIDAADAAHMAAASPELMLRLIAIARAAEPGLEALERIAQMTDPSPAEENYRADDREGCLDAVHAETDAAIAALRAALEELTQEGA